MDDRTQIETNSKNLITERTLLECLVNLTYIVYASEKIDQALLVARQELDRIENLLLFPVTDHR